MKISIVQKVQDVEWFSKKGVCYVQAEKALCMNVGESCVCDEFCINLNALNFQGKRKKISRNIVMT